MRLRTLVVALLAATTLSVPAFAQDGDGDRRADSGEALPSSGGERGGGGESRRGDDRGIPRPEFRAAPSVVQASDGGSGDSWRGRGSPMANPQPAPVFQAPPAPPVETGNGGGGWRGGRGGWGGSNGAAPAAPPVSVAPAPQSDGGWRGRRGGEGRGGESRSGEGRGGEGRGGWGGNRGDGVQNPQDGWRGARGGEGRGGWRGGSPPVSTPPVSTPPVGTPSAGAPPVGRGDPGRGTGRGWRGNDGGWRGTDGRGQGQGWGNRDTRRDNDGWRGQGYRRDNGWRNNDGWRGQEYRRNDGWRNDGRRYGTQRWDQSWRNDRRYDWQRYRSYNRNAYRIGRYDAPYGYNYGYRRFSIGLFLGSAFYAQSYWINQPWDYRLPQVDYPYRWVRYYNDVLLIDTESGEVVDVIHDFFW
jgi:Nickel/cobalt transporter regulator